MCHSTPLSLLFFFPFYAQPLQKKIYKKLMEGNHLGDGGCWVYKLSRPAGHTGIILTLFHSVEEESIDQRFLVSLTSLRFFSLGLLIFDTSHF